MKKKVLAGLATGLVLFGMVEVATATLIEVDWQVAGDKAILRDTATGLDWLDLKVTANIDYNKVLSELGSGGDYEGFSFATSAQIDTMFINAYITNPSFGVWEASNYDSAVVLRAAWGSTDPADTATQFFLAGEGHATNSQQGGAISVSSDTSEDMAYATSSDEDLDRTMHNPYLASALVRSFPAPVPEPATMLLFGTGLAGLAGVGRRRKNK